MSLICCIESLDSWIAHTVYTDHYIYGYWLILENVTHVDIICSLPMQINVTGFQSSTYLSFLTLFCTFGKVGLEVSLQHESCMPIKQLIFITNKVCMYTSLLLYHTYNYIITQLLHIMYVRTYVWSYWITS